MNKEGGNPLSHAGGERGAGKEGRLPPSRRGRDTSLKEGGYLLYEEVSSRGDDGGGPCGETE